MQITLGKQWTRIDVRTGFDGAVVALHQGDQAIAMPVDKVIALAKALRRTRAKRK